MNKFLVAGIAAMVAVSGAANATALVSVDTTDLVYGSFSGSLAKGVTGTAAQLTWRSAGFGWTGNVGLTNGAGEILFDVTTHDDIYTLFAHGSGDARLGTACAGNATVCLVLPSHVPTSLYNAVNTANGGSGICCYGKSDIVVTGSTVPEPAAWTLLIAGFAMTGTALRSRSRNALTA